MSDILTKLERRALAFIWADVDPGLGQDLFGSPADDLTHEVLFGDFLRRYLVQHQPNMRAFRPRPDAFRRDADGALIISCSGEKGRRYEAHLLLNDDGSVAVFAIGRAPPPGMHVREARPDEYERVAEIIRDCPIVTGNRSLSVWLRRLPEALAMQRHFSVIVVERESDGALLAVRASGRRQAVLMDETLWVGQAYQAAVLPEARGFGLENAIIPLMTRAHARHAKRFYGLVDAGNVAILQAMGGDRVPVWRHTVRQVGVLSTPDAETFGRPATAEDVPRLLELLIAAHGRKAWRPVFDPEWVRQRFATIASYRHDAIRMTGNAFIALWPAGDVIADLSPTRSRHARFAYMADYGFEGEEGASDFSRLVNDARRRACEAGCTHAIAYTCDASPGADILGAAADFDDRMYLTLAPPEPATVGETGIYVDTFFA